jgi:hypothetical protein
MAFGAVGLVLTIATAALILTTLGGVADAATGLERQRTQLGAMLEPASAALRNASASAAHAGSSLTSSAAAAREAAGLTAQLGSSFEQLAALSSFELLGTRPFAGPAASFADAAVRSRAVSTNLDTTARALTLDITDSATVAADLDRLADQLDELRRSMGVGPGGAGSGLTASASFDIARIVLVGLLAWLAVPAAVSLWLGRRLSSHGRPDRPAG